MPVRSSFVAIALMSPASGLALPTVLSLQPNATTVSGFSYGGDMAVQAHVAYSKTIVGACGFAAQPVYCAVKKWTREPTMPKGTGKGKGVPFCDGCVPLETVEFDHCRTHPEYVDVGQLPDWPRRNCGQPFRANCLDDVVNMYDSRVFLQVGAADTHTPADAVANTFGWYATMLADPQHQIKYTESATPAGHAPPANGASECLAHLYPSATPLAPPASASVPASLLRPAQLHSGH